MSFFYKPKNNGYNRNLVESSRVSWRDLLTEKLPSSFNYDLRTPLAEKKDGLFGPRFDYTKEEEAEEEEDIEEAKDEKIHEITTRKIRDETGASGAQQSGNAQKIMEAVKQTAEKVQNVTSSVVSETKDAIVKTVKEKVPQVVENVKEGIHDVVHKSTYGDDMNLMVDTWNEVEDREEKMEEKQKEKIKEKYQEFQKSKYLNGVFELHPEIGLEMEDKFEDLLTEIHKDIEKIVQSGEDDYKKLEDYGLLEYKYDAREKNIIKKAEKSLGVILDKDMLNYLTNYKRYREYGRRIAAKDRVGKMKTLGIKDTITVGELRELKAKKFNPLSLEKHQNNES